MPAAFSRTLRSLRNDGVGRTAAAMLVGGALLAGWMLWLFLAEVTVYEVAVSARVEVSEAVAPIAARVSGRVVRSQLALGQQVAAGEVLVELDSERERLELTQGQARLEALTAQLAPLREQIAVREETMGRAREAERAEVAEARARSEEAQSRAAFRQSDAERAAQLSQQGLLARREAEERTVDAETSRSAVTALRSAVGRIEAEHRRRLGEFEAELAGLRRELARVTAEITAARAMVEQLEHEVELRRIRAPVDGQIGEIVPLQVGTILAEGERIGSVVPVGTLAVVASFPPAAIGRLRIGQQARLRLDGFSPLQYGTVAATVSSIGSELRDGHVRVELALARGAASRILLQHGLPGTVEVAVERVAPVILVLRATGRLLMGDRI
jgi:multidrug resistance efflux pump